MRLHALAGCRWGGAAGREGYDGLKHRNMLI